MKWSAVSPSKMCFCEKMRMYMLDNMVPSPAILSQGYICDYRNLTATFANLDEIRKNPDKKFEPYEITIEYPSKDFSLVQQMIEKNQDFEGAYNIIMKEPHQKLWEYLAEKALDSLNFKYAEKAFSLCKDFAKYFHKQIF